MIHVESRRLNSRFYVGPIVITAKNAWGYEIAPKMTSVVIDLWVDKMNEILSLMLEAVACEGSIGGTFSKDGFATHGKIYVFGDDSIQAIEPFIKAFTDVMRVGQDLSTEPFAASVECKICIQSVLLEDEGITVPFAELDTEPAEKPKSGTRVNLLSLSALN